MTVAGCLIGRLAGRAGGGVADLIGIGFAAAVGGGATAMAGGRAAVGFGFAAGSPGSVARTAFWKVADSRPTFFCRQASASFPAGVTREQCAEKPERQC